ncbi:MAG: zinc ribbon domain-containing protein [Kiritimatiellia bacterium]
MPIYEYECTQCKKRFEHLLKNSRDVPAACPGCGAKKVSRVFSSFSVSMGAAKAPAMPPACASCTSAGCPHRK